MQITTGDGQAIELRVLVARFKSSCAGCGALIEPGEVIAWAKDAGSYHVQVSAGCPAASPGQPPEQEKLLPTPPVKGLGRRGKAA